MQRKSSILGVATLLIATLVFSAGIVAAHEVGVEWTSDYGDERCYCDENYVCIFGMHYNDPDEGYICLHNLENTEDDATGFYNKLKDDGWTGDFNNGDPDAWEEHFKKVSLGGTDTSYVDDQDFAYYAGHGSPTGFYFNNNHDDKKLRCTDTHHDAEWGNTDLEWIALHCCEILSDNNTHGEWYERWAFDVFKGLHQIQGFCTVAIDVPNMGSKFAYYMIDLEYTIRESWREAAEDTQPSGIVVAILGVSDSGYNTWNDHLWGHGSVASDKSDPSNFYRVLYTV
jgi:hypothetical protein